MLKKIIILPLFVLCFLVIGAKSQPTEIKIKSISIKNMDATNPFSRLDIVTDQFTDSAGEAWGFSGLNRCLPCRSGETVGSSRSSSTGIRFGKFLGNGVTRFYELINGGISSDSAQIPYFAPKNRQIELFTSARIFGDLTVYDQTQNGNRTMLYTSPIDLNGTAKISFSPLSTPLFNTQFGYVKTSIFRQVELAFVE